MFGNVVVYVMFSPTDNASFNLFAYTSPRSPVRLKKNQLVSNVFVVDDAAQAYNIYLIVFPCLSNYGSRCLRIYIESTKNAGFHTFF